MNWKPIAGTSGRYQVSVLGHLAVIDEAGNRSIVQCERGADGLRRVRIRRRGKLERLKVRELVAAAWLSPMTDDEGNGILPDGADVDLRSQYRDPADTSAAGLLRITLESAGRIASILSSDGERIHREFDRQVAESAEMAKTEQ